MALFTVVTMTSGWPLRSAISAASRLSSLPCPTWWAYTWCALRGWLVSAEVGWGRKPPENMVKMAKIHENPTIVVATYGSFWKVLENGFDLVSWKPLSDLEKSGIMLRWAWCPKWGQILNGSQVDFKRRTWIWNSPTSMPTSPTQLEALFSLGFGQVFCRHFRWIGSC